MTNHEYAMRTALIAKRAATYTHDILTMGRAYGEKPVGPQAATNFCRDIREMVDCMEREVTEAA